MMILWRQRVTVRRYSIHAAAFTTINSGMGRRMTGLAEFIESLMVAVIQKLLVLVVSHLWPPFGIGNDGVNQSSVN
jgi:hypothetical protein